MFGSTPAPPPPSLDPMRDLADTARRMEVQLASLLTWTKLSAVMLVVLVLVFLVAFL
jgi:hypothetical protein